MDTFLSILTFPMNIISAIAGLFKAQSYLAFFSNNSWAYVLCSIVLWLGIFGAIVDYIKKKVQ